MKTCLLLSIAMLTLILFFQISGCGSDTVTPSVPTPTSTPVNTPTTAPTSLPTAVPTVTATPTPAGLSDITNQFNGSSVFFTSNNAFVPNVPKINSLQAAPTTTNAGTLYIRLRQNLNSSLSVTDLELKAADNPGFPFFNGFAAIGLPTWQAFTSTSLFAWFGSPPMILDTAYDFKINYNVSPASFPKTVKLIITGGQNNQELGYVILPIVFSPPNIIISNPN